MLLDPRYAQPLVFDELYGPGDLRCEMKNLHASFLLWSGCSDWTSSAPLRRSQLRSSCESLDTDMARALGAGSLDGETYGCAWRVVRRAEDREQRVALMLAMSAALDRHTRNALLRHSLRLRRPASQAAGLGSLQRFAKSGFEVQGNEGCRTLSANDRRQRAGAFSAFVRRRKRPRRDMRALKLAFA